MSTEPVDLDTWCFWLNVALNPLGYSATVTPTDLWFYTAREVIRIDDVERHSPLRGYARILWPAWQKCPGHRGYVAIRWDMDYKKYGDMVDAAFGAGPDVLYGWCRYHPSSIMREECAGAYANPEGLTPENLAPRIVRVFDAPPICPGTIWARNKEKELHITYDWSICHEEHQ